MKSIQVFEYQTIHIGYEGVFEERHLQLLARYLEEQKEPYYELRHRGVRFKQFVGVLQAGDLTIEVLPKLDKQSEQSMQPFLLHLLKVCHSLKTYNFQEAQLRTQRKNVLDLYVSLFLQEIEQLLHNGLIKQYRRKEGNLNALKGRLHFEKNLRRNLIHKERFYVSYQTYDQQHLLHQIIHEALSVLGSLSGYFTHTDRVQRNLLLWPEQPRLRVEEGLFERISFNRKTKPYQQAIHIARLILLNFHPDFRGGNSSVLALLFDMNKLFEQYVAIQFKKALRGTKYKVTTQTSKSFWKGDSRSPQKIRPDIVISNGEENWVIDTKWKLPQKQRPSDDDLRQLYVYGKYYNAKQTFLLYPSPTTTHKVSGEYQGTEGAGQYCHLLFWPLLDEERSSLKKWGIGELEEWVFATTFTKKQFMTETFQP